MQTAVDGSTATVDQLGILLQNGVSQSEVFDMIYADAVLASSFWVNVALAGLSILLFVYMGRNVEDPRAQLIFVATIVVPAVSLSSYLGLASGLTVSVVEMPGGALAGEEVLSMWGRYLTWTLSTPMILLALGLLAGSNSTKIFTAIVFDVAMCVTGLAAALTTSSYALRWAWYGVSCTFFAVVLYVLLVEWPRDATETGTAEIFNTLKLLTVILWFGYPIFWALGAEGIGVLGVAVTSWAYSALDVGAKYVFAYLLLSYVADEPASVTGLTSIAGGETPADD
jgi:halorhodopsin